MQIFKSPCKTVLDCSALEKAILVWMDQVKNHLLQSVCKKFGNDFESTIDKGYGSEFCRSRCCLCFRNQGDDRVIDALEIDFAMIEIINKPVKVRCNNSLACFQESGIKTIWSRRFVSWHMKDHMINL